ncbi:hypothetical protein KAU11_08995 [Candidatus Babeliales bacterium]|nr:hypothetical protein [Candidatus Babeliales bacterium]
MGKDENKSNLGQPKKIPDAETLYSWFEVYKKWRKDNPFKKMDFKGKDADKVTYELERPLTWVGFSVWLYKNKTVSNIDEYKANKDNVYKDYSSILRVIGEEIYQHQYDGATVGIFQQNIIARKLGLTEKSEVKSDITIKETRIGFDPKKK